VLIVGNSVAFYLGEEGFKPISRSYKPPLNVLDVSVVGCTFPPEVTTKLTLGLPDGQVFPAPACDPDWEAGVVQRYRPKVVLWIVSDASGTGGTYRGQRVRPCSQPFDSLYQQRLKQEVAILGASGARVVLTTAAYARYLNLYSAVSDRSVDCENQLVRAVAASTGAQLVDIGNYICPLHHCRVKQNGVTLRPDGLHFEGRSARIVARWLIDQVKHG
jgi:hypothetical protein